MSLACSNATGFHAPAAQRVPVYGKPCSSRSPRSRLSIHDTRCPALLNNCRDRSLSGHQATRCACSDCTPCEVTQSLSIRIGLGDEGCPGVIPDRQCSRPFGAISSSLRLHCKVTTGWHYSRRRSVVVAGSYDGAGSVPSRDPSGTGMSQESDSGKLPDTRAARFSKVKWVRSLLKQPKAEESWSVPWGFGTIIFVMIAWFVAYWSVGSWGIPMAAEFIGCNLGALGLRGQAVYSLVTDIIHSALVWFVLGKTLQTYRPLPKNWFPISWKGPGYLEAVLACFSFPIVVFLSELNVRLVPGPVFPTMLEKSLGARDPVAMVLYAIVVSVFAPVWEEYLFRGFMLPSLTRYIPPWGSVGVSALFFALVHGQLQRVFPLFFLGVIIGIVFIRSKNLLAAILLHSLWNLFVFVTLFSN